MPIKELVDLMVAASKNKKYIDEYKAATSATNLQKRWLEIKPGYFVSMEACVKLFKSRKKILDDIQEGMY
jgi:hypothetical protein